MATAAFALLLGPFVGYGVQQLAEQLLRPPSDHARELAFARTSDGHGFVHVHVFQELVEKVRLRTIDLVAVRLRPVELACVEVAVVRERVALVRSVRQNPVLV